MSGRSDPWPPPWAGPSSEGMNTSAAQQPHPDFGCLVTGYYSRTPGNRIPRDWGAVVSPEKCGHARSMHDGELLSIPNQGLGIVNIPP